MSKFTTEQLEENVSMSTIYLSPEVLQELYELGYDFDPSSAYYDAEEGFTFSVFTDDLKNTSAINTHQKLLKKHPGKIILCKSSNSGPGWFELKKAE